jgi:hypothetical protein
MVNKDGTEDLRKYNPGRKGYKGTLKEHDEESMDDLDAEDYDR